VPSLALIGGVMRLGTAPFSFPLLVRFGISSKNSEIFSLYFQAQKFCLSILFLGAARLDFAVPRSRVSPPPRVVAKMAAAPTEILKFNTNDQIFTPLA
jgi:hypothetical protein